MFFGRAMTGHPGGKNSPSASAKPLHMPKMRVELMGHFANRSPSAFSQLIAQFIADSPYLNVPKRAQPVVCETRSPKRKLHLASEQVEAIVADYRAGSTAKELGAKFGIHRSTVSGLLKRRGVTLRSRSLGAKEVANAIELY